MHIYKKVLPAAVAMALAACGGGSDSVEDQSQGSTALGTFPKFNPITSELPLNTDLIFADAATTDGTANIGVPENPIEAAVNGLDGFSTNAYFDIAFDGDSIDPATICVPGGCAGLPNVFLVPLDTSGGDGDALNPANIVGVDQAAFATTAISASVVSLDGGTDNTLRITPLQPLLAKTKYLAFVTNGIMDTSGDPIKASTSYNLLGENEPAVADSLEAVRGAIQGWETIAGGLINALSGGLVPVDAAKDSVAISFTFTTTDPLTPLVAMGAPRAAVTQAIINTGVDAGTAAGFATSFENGGLLSTPKARPVAVNAATGQDFSALSGGALAASVGTLYTGSITLPYYLTAPAAEGDYSFLQKDWSADQVLGSQLGAGVPPMDVDGSYNVTYRYPFAAKTGDEQIPLQVTLPNPALTPAELGGASCADVEGSTGYPVVIYVHGITSDRTSVVALGHSLASKCVATVAIDLPVHGVPASSPFAAALNVENNPAFASLYGADLHERHFNVVKDASGNPAAMNFASPSALDGSGAWFINLADLGNTRDNLRQGVMDLMNLNASLDAISALDIATNGTLNTGNVTVVGVSLGGIVGTVFTTANQIAISNDSSFGSNLNPIGGLVASAAGGQLSQVLSNSLALGPVVNAGLAASGVNVGTSNYEKFLYVAQSTVDSGDPVNFASTLASLGVPVLLQEIVGGGDATGLGDAKVYTADKVIPNSVAHAPLAGTEPLASLLGAALPAASPGASDVTSGNLLIRLAIGHHASLLRPSEDGVTAATNGENVATAELQTEVVSFVLAKNMTAVGTGAGNAAAPFVEIAAP